MFDDPADDEDPIEDFGGDDAVEGESELGPDIPSAPDSEKEFDVVDSESNLQPEIPSAPDPPPATAASKELQSAFWSIVVVVNLALLAGSLGAMFLVFRGRLRLGGGLLAVGLLGIGHAYKLYREFEYG